MSFNNACLGLIPRVTASPPQNGSTNRRRAKGFHRRARCGTCHRFPPAHFNGGRRDALFPPVPAGLGMGAISAGGCCAEGDCSDISTEYTTRLTGDGGAEWEEYSSRKRDKCCPDPRLPPSRQGALRRPRSGQRSQAPEEGISGTLRAGQGREEVSRCRSAPAALSTALR